MRGPPSGYATSAPRCAPPPPPRFTPATGLAPRNSTEGWFSTPSDGVGNALRNAVALLPVLLLRMPLLLLAPLALWPLRRNLALALLVPWILLALYPYLSVDWIVQYARPDLVPWEPRDFMPAPPPLAVLRGGGGARPAP